MRCLLVLFLPAFVSTMSLPPDIAPSPPRVLGLGSAGVDFIALVDRYPEPDAKIRTESLEVVGGGNCGNTLTCVSRLGLHASIVTKVGADANGRLILDGLRAEGVDTSLCYVSAATLSPFTYVIVDREAGTRTCIHTPQTEELLPEEINDDMLLGGASSGETSSGGGPVAAVHLCGRHTAAAVALARAANRLGIPVVLDAEKDRPHFRELLPLADVIVANKGFPSAFTGRPDRIDAMSALLDVGRAKFVISTLGEQGSVLLHRAELPWPGFADSPARSDAPAAATAAAAAATSVTAAAAAAASDAALSSLAPAVLVEPRRADGRGVLRCPAWPVAAADVVDTTGAGDAFIGAVIYGLVHQLPAAQFLALASLVAARKLRAPGARAGLPTAMEAAAYCPGLMDAAPKAPVGARALPPELARSA
ncbi:unnamed protein product [Phaeothamnion confervicola]